MSFLLLYLITSPARAEQFGDFTYSVIGGSTVTITGFTSTTATSADIPASISGMPVTAIGSNAFSSRRQLHSVTIPPSVSSIGAAAFSSCTGITSVTIPSSVISTGEGAFRRCSGLTQVVINNSVIAKSQFSGCTALTQLEIAGSVSEIGASAFAYCTGLAEITIPASVTSIGYHAFLGCNSLTGVLIPASVTSIGEFAFIGCAGLSEVTIPAAVASIGAGAFSACTRLQGLVAAENNPVYSSSNGVLFDKAQSTLVAYPGGRSGTYLIPPGVSSVMQDAFFGCIGLTGITIPSSVTSVGPSAFGSCTGLEAFAVAEDNPALGTLDGVLFNRGYTMLVAFPAARQGAYVIPASVAAIGAGAFTGCSGLTNVTMPDSVLTIGTNAFENCARLAAVTISDSITTIHSGAFGGCSGLIKVTIPATAGSLGSFAFSGCTGLESVTFAGSATSFEASAFSSCSALKRVNLLGNAPSSWGNRFPFHRGTNFKVWFFADRTGFTAPTWEGYASESMGPSSPFKIWALVNGFSHADSPLADPNGDGVSNLMAYALSLNPGANLSAAVPRPVLGASEMTLTFPTGRARVTYAAETSTDLTNWTPVGLSAPDASGQRTAAVPRTDAARMLRLRVTMP